MESFFGEEEHWARHLKTQATGPSPLPPHANSKRDNPAPSTKLRELLPNILKVNICVCLFFSLNTSKHRLFQGSRRTRSFLPRPGPDTITRMFSRRRSWRSRTCCAPRPLASTSPSSTASPRNSSRDRWLRCPPPPPVPWGRSSPSFTQRPGPRCQWLSAWIRTRTERRTQREGRQTVKPVTRRSPIWDWWWRRCCTRAVDVRGHAKAEGDRRVPEAGSSQ